MLRYSGKLGKKAEKTPGEEHQRLENPCKANPTVKTLEKVAKAFGKRLEIGLV
jgi:hypothetical protein